MEPRKPWFDIALYLAANTEIQRLRLLSAIRVYAFHSDTKVYQHLSDDYDDYDDALGLRPANNTAIGQ